MAAAIWPPRVCWAHFIKSLPSLAAFSSITAPAPLASSAVVCAATLAACCSEPRSGLPMATASGLLLSASEGMPPSLCCMLPGSVLGPSPVSCAWSRCAGYISRAPSRLWCGVPSLRRRAWCVRLWCLSARPFFGLRLPCAGRGFDDCDHLKGTQKAGWRTSTVPILYLWTIGLVCMTPALNAESRAVRGFQGGGPTRTRTVDQRIMSPLL